MPILRAKPQSWPQHWSKDFVEHLRTVHFALVALSVGLVIILLSKPYDPRIAAAQLTDIVALKGQFAKPEDLHGVLVSAQVPFSDATSATVSPNAVPYSPLFVYGNIEGKPFQINLPQPWVFCDNTGQWSAAPDMPAFNTVRQFRDWWIVGMHEDVFRITLVENSTSFKRIDNDQVLQVSGKPGMSAGETFNLKIVGSCRSNAQPLSLVGGNKEYKVAIQVLTLTKIPVSPSSLLQTGAFHYHGRLARLGTIPQFENFFPDLSIAARGREDRDFEKLISQLYSEESKEEGFDVLGIRIPSEQITSLGIVALISIQLYLLMYFRQLSNKLREGDPGWDTPWMAMDPSLLGKCMLFASIVLLPILAAGFILFRSASHVDPGLPNLLYLSWKSEGVVVCVVLSILCWRYRPKLTESDTPQEVLEDQGAESSHTNKSVTGDP